MAVLEIHPIGWPDEIRPGDDLALQIGDSLLRNRLSPQQGDLIAVAQKAISKAEGRFVRLADIVPDAEAEEVAAKTKKDPRLIRLILDQSSAIVRAAPGILIVRHHLGFVLANAGIDSSNVPGATRDEMVLLLPRDPDASARSLRERLVERFGVELAVIISDSFGRPWRRGVVNVAIGTAGLQSLIDRRGELDREGRMLEGTEVAIADAAAAATGLAMGEAAESCPAALLRGLNLGEAAGSAQDLLRPLEQDLFQ